MTSADQTFSSTRHPSVLGVVLAGGLSRRMGGQDKSLLPWKKTTLLEQVVSRAQPQVSQLIVSANRPSALLSQLALTVVPDANAGAEPAYSGPLAGIVSAMRWSQQENTGHDWLASFATDTPFVPADFVAQCLATAQTTGADIVCARSGGRDHYTLSLWRMRLLPTLQQHLEQGERALKTVFVHTRFAHTRAEACEFSVTPFDPFFNINTHDDWLQAQRYLHDAEK